MTVMTYNLNRRCSIFVCGQGRKGGEKVPRSVSPRPRRLHVKLRRVLHPAEEPPRPR